MMPPTRRSATWSAREIEHPTSRTGRVAAKNVARRQRGPRMEKGAIHRKFTEALDTLVEQVKGDRSVLAAILCGSLSHDAVWAKSDIDLVLVTIDDKKAA